MELCGGLNEEYFISVMFIEGQTHFGMPRGAKLSLALNEPEWIALHSKLNTCSEHALQVDISNLILYAKVVGKLS